MTREEFIDGYCKRGGYERYKTATGLRIGDHAKIALPCACGDKMCDGWAMIPDDPDSIADHNKFNGPAPADR